MGDDNLYLLFGTDLDSEALEVRRVLEANGIAVHYRLDSGKDLTGLF